MKHGNKIKETNIPGIFNEEADIESRKHETRTEWVINRKYFEKIIKSLNFNPTVHLFATRLDTHLPHFISINSDPEYKGANAFTLSRENLLFYTFPPFNCIPNFANGLA